MRKTASIIGIAWMVIVGIAGFGLGIAEAMGAYPGLFFRGGYGEVYLLFALALPGYALYRWGNTHAS
jgi:hypothetical protein